jgi:hypothetical protein
MDTAEEAAAKLTERLQRLQRRVDDEVARTSNVQTSMRSNA